jgi:hypothetical protein
MGADNACGHIGINSVEWLTTVHDLTSRGLSIFELVTNDCTAINHNHFDASAYSADSAALASYINGLHQSAVLIGVATDDAQCSLTRQAKDALLVIVANLNA